MKQTCELCQQDGGTILWRTPHYRVIRVADPHNPGFCRVIWNAHVREMSDLDAVDRNRLMQAVFAVEQVIRQCFQPDKINLASFGNVVPHLHWHVIPRWEDDPHFPEPIWGRRMRDNAPARPPVSDSQLADALATALADLR